MAAVVWVSSHTIVAVCRRVLGPPAAAAAVKIGSRPLVLPWWRRCKLPSPVDVVWQSLAAAIYVHWPGSWRCPTPTPTPPAPTTTSRSSSRMAALAWLGMTRGGPLVVWNALAYGVTGSGGGGGGLTRV
jgi:hypothetical protein